jgi:hypothetical protein
MTVKERTRKRQEVRPLMKRTGVWPSNVVEWGSMN